MLKINTIDKSLVLKYFINIFCSIIILIALYTAYSLYSVDRSLWLDEAMLAYSFSERGLVDLTFEIFDWHQSAPILYLYVVKIITLLFGNTEFSLRIWSFIAYILTVACSFYILSKIFHVRYPLIGTAFIANLHILMTYSNEFKPYMTDCFVVLALFILYFLYRKEKCKWYVLIITFSIMIWFSNPSCFFIGAVLLYEFCEGLFRKNRRRIIETIIGGAVILLSFLLYYFYWLKPEIDTGVMTAFWQYQRFPLIPTSSEDFQRAILLVKELLGYFGHYHIIMLVVVIVGGIYNFFKTNTIITVSILGIFLLFFASMIGFFPVKERMCLFLYPLVAILFFCFFDKIFSGKLKGDIFLIGISIVLIFSANGITFYKNKENIRRRSEETNKAIEFIRNNICEDERIYVYHSTVPGFCYKTRFTDNNKIDFKNQVFLGKESFIDSSNKEAIQLIINNAPVYILISSVLNQQPEMIDSLFEELGKTGNVEQVYDEYETYVYYYRNTPDKPLVLSNL